MLRLIALFIFSFVLTACASSTPLTVHQINALSSAQTNDGQFLGLEYLADEIPGQYKYRVNVMYLHGIGWTEDRTADQLAGDFLGGSFLGQYFLGQYSIRTCRAG